MATESLAKYCVLMANLIPQHFEAEHEHTLTTDRLEDSVRRIEANFYT